MAASAGPLRVLSLLLCLRSPSGGSTPSRWPMEIGARGATRRLVFRRLRGGQDFGLSEGGMDLGPPRGEAGSGVDTGYKKLKFYADGQKMSLKEQRRQGLFTGSYNQYARQLQRQEKQQEIESQKMTIENEIFEEIMSWPELSESHKESLWYHIQKMRLRVQDMTEDLLNDLLTAATKPLAVPAKLVGTLWGRLENAARQVAICQKTGVLHPRIIREAQRGVTAKELRRPPPDIEIFSARHIAQTLLVQRRRTPAQPPDALAPPPPHEEGGDQPLVAMNRSMPTKEEKAVAAHAAAEKGAQEGRGGARVPSPSWCTSPLFTKAALQVVKAGKTDGPAITIGRSAFLVMGREPSLVDIPALHPSISRRHVSLGHDAEGDVFVTDLGSAHGTSINGRRITPHQPTILLEGDALACGSSTRRYVMCYYRTMAEQREIDRIYEAKRRKLKPVPPVMGAEGGSDICMSDDSGNGRGR